MRSSITIKSVGLSVSAALVVLYVLVVLASLLLVGLLTTGSWQSLFLGIGVSTLVGFEIGLLGVVILSFALAGVIVTVYKAVHRAVIGRSTTLEQPVQRNSKSSKSWSGRLLLICLVLPALALVVLRVAATVVTMGSSSERLWGPSQRSGEQVEPVNMGNAINTAYREAEPTFTADGRTMFFNCNSGDICVSNLVGTWEEGSWTPPERLGAPVNTEYEEVEPVINAAGDKLYFTSIRPIGWLKGFPFLSPFMNVFRVANTLAIAKLGRTWFSGLGLPDVYVTYWVNGSWSEPQSLNEAGGEPPVNTPFDDHCLFFSADGNEAFWTSTRPGGFGGNDIWTSRRVNGRWTPPENLGSNVNGPGGEHTSIPTPDGRSLFITTTRDGGYGGEDIFVTRRGVDGVWGELVNLGPLVNGPGDDRCPAWTPDLKIFLFDSVRKGGVGARDIWWVYFEDVIGYPLAKASTDSLH